MRNQLARWIATTGGIGYIPGAPGTYGAMIAVIVYVLLHEYSTWNIDLVLTVLIIIGTIAGTWSAKILESDWGHDPSKIVMDETIGQWIVFLFIPFSWVNVVLGFALFRFFDIAKPLGIRKIDNTMHSPFSVMLDDILAGVYALIVLHIVQFIL